MKKNQKPKDNKSKKQKKSETIKTIILTIVLIACLATSIFLLYLTNKESEEKEIAYTELITSINEGEVEKIEMTTGSATITVVMHGEGEEKDREKTVFCT